MAAHRPLQWDEYIGQTKLKERLKTHIHAALDRMERLDHILLVGVPGCGKTTLAKLIAQEAQADTISFVPPIKKTVLANIVRSHIGVLFIDELHLMSKADQHLLLPLLEDGWLQLDNGMQIENHDLTVIGATTEPQDIIPPLFDRFLIRPPFADYEDDEMAGIVMRMAEKEGVALAFEDALILGRAAGGVPRRAVSFVNMARDADVVDADTILAKAQVTDDGLEKAHLDYLRVLFNNAGTCGLDLLSAHLRLPKPVIIDLERLLAKRKFIEFTKAGRQATHAAFKKYGKA